MDNSLIYTITLLPSDVSFKASSDMTLLESALKSKVVLSYSCNNGSCDTCEVEIYDENCTKENRKILSCQYKPEKSLKIKADYYPQLSGIEVITSPCKVNEYIQPTKDIAILTLRLPPKVKFNFLPGQYVDLKFQGVSRSYSVASLPNDENIIELHLKNVPDGVMSSKIFKPVVSNQLMQIEGPKGTFFIRDRNADTTVFLATGTGFAPVKSMVTDLILNGYSGAIYIYWGNRFKELFYDKTPESWPHEYDNISYKPCLSKDDEDWNGCIGYIQDFVLKDAQDANLYDLENVEVYACGSNEMIQSAKDKLIKAGLKRDKFYSDAFVAS